MEWRNYPDPSYLPDVESQLLISKATRVKLFLFDYFRMLFAGVLLICLTCLFFYTIIKYNLNDWMVYAIFSIVAVCITGMFFIPGFAMVPLLCSTCSRCMSRQHCDTSEGEDVLFYVCTKCKRYVDSGR